MKKNIIVGTKVILKETGNVADRHGNLNQDNIKGVVKKVFKYTDSEYKYKVKTGQGIYRYCKASDIYEIEED